MMKRARLFARSAKITKQWPRLPENKHTPRYDYTKQTVSHGAVPFIRVSLWVLKEER